MKTQIRRTYVHFLGLFFLLGCTFAQPDTMSECGLTLSKANKYFFTPADRQALLGKDADLDEANRWLEKTLAHDSTHYKAASGINWSALDEGRLTCQEGILYLDEMHRAEKFSNGIDSIVFIQPQLPEVRVPRMVEEKKDTFCLEKEIEIQIPQSTATATVKGWATFRIQISNRSESSSGEIEVEMSAGNTRDAWKGSLEAGSTKTINFSVPARISTPSITRNLTIVVRQKENKLETVQKITIRRYTPDNRR